MTTTAMKSAATTLTEAEPLKLRKRIGSTTFVVSVRFSETGNETAQDKLLRLIESDPLATQSARCWPGGQTGVTQSA